MTKQETCATVKMSKKDVYKRQAIHAAQRVCHHGEGSAAAVCVEYVGLGLPGGQHGLVVGRLLIGKELGLSLIHIYVAVNTQKLVSIVMIIISVIAMVFSVITVFVGWFLLRQKQQQDRKSVV